MDGWMERPGGRMDGRGTGIIRVEGGSISAELAFPCERVWKRMEEPCRNARMRGACGRVCKSMGEPCINARVKGGLWTRMYAK